MLGTTASEAPLTQSGYRRRSMASRKEQKEQARAARIAQEQAVAAQQQRKRRFQIFGGVIALAIVVVVVVIAVGSGGGSGPTKNAYPTVHSQLAGIPQDGVTLGNPSAKFTLTYFGDLQCPICRDFTVTPSDLPQFIHSQVRTGKAKVLYRSFCTATCNDYSNGQHIFKQQQTAAYAAGKQHLFWDYAELFYHEQQAEGSGYVTAAWLQGLAKQIPKLKLSTWETDLKDPVLADQVSSDTNAAIKLKLTGTPTLIMKGPKGSETVTGPGGTIPSASDLEAAMKALA